MSPAIAIVGLACRYPDADSPAELWRNVLACRQAFRRVPPERLRLADYLSADRTAPDRTYAAQAAVLDGWQFDRVRHRIAGSTFRSTDLAQWLALDVAGEALDDGGWPSGAGLPRERTGVVLGNTLTGEFSRARLLRLRWPYVRRTVARALEQEGWSPEAAAGFLGRLEPAYKAPFAPIDDEALAGSLSNTIAGRVCNTFDLRGGGYTVDGACAASLLAVATACGALVAGDIDVAIAGGVDLSLDPFELVGFAKVGALAADAMRVYDARPTGFIPGEGCGIVALERLSDARARGARVYAVIRGWGTSSDGAGGITRPEAAGQMLALRRAYARAGFGIGTVDLFEGHGTGTQAGDAAELLSLSRAREAEGFAEPAAIGSVKANIGHTKAAAGAAGLVKAAMSLHERVIPPTTGCETPSDLLVGPRRALRPVVTGEPWPHGRPGRAGVSSAGFGGINAHVVLEGRSRRRRLSGEQRTLLRSSQDAELLPFAAATIDELRSRVAAVRRVAEELSVAEIGDLAATLHRALPRRRAGHSARAAIVASTAPELARGLELLTTRLRAGNETPPEIAGVVCASNVFFGCGSASPRVGLLFPGQGSPTVLDGGALGRRFGWFARIARDPLADGDRASDPHARADTAIAQPAIVACSLGGLAFLRALGVRGDAAVGHSLGELTALHWAGALEDGDLRALAAARGRAMAQLGAGDGAMASIAAGADAVHSLLGDGVVLAGLNGPCQTVVSGRTAAVEQVMRRAANAGLATTRLPVSHAFHSPLVAHAAGPLAAALDGLDTGRVDRLVCSTITGEPLSGAVDLRRMLVAQVTEPVRFEAALRAAQERAEVFVEVGPGAVLTGLAREITERPVLAMDAGGPSLRPALAVAGALFASGAATTMTALFAGRFTRPFALDRRRAFLANPCELAPADDATATEPPAAEPPVTAARDVDAADDVLAVVRRLAAARLELPESAVSDDARLLADLHLTSIAVGELAAAVARTIGSTPPEPPTEMATATIAELARAVEAARAGGGDSSRPAVPDGVAAWVRTFAVRLERREPPPRRDVPACRWTVHAPDEHPLLPAIETAFAGGEGEQGVVVCLPPDPEDSHAELLLRALGGASRCAFLQHGGGAGGFARSLWLERPDLHVGVVELPLDDTLLGRARAEAEAVTGFAEIRLDAGGGRRVPVWRALEPRPGAPLLHDGDVLLVSGGGKGIAAECALDLAAASGASAVLLGRSRPQEDAELAGNLARFAEAGVRHRYASVDVTDAGAVGGAVATAVAELGPVTAILHGAGVNVPARLEDLDAAEIDRTLAPKLDGARALLGAVDRARLRLVVTFGSIIGRMGLRGEAHYALANDRMAQLVERLDDELPDCRCLNVEWSVWTGAGMADRLGTIAALAQLGVSPIPVDAGVRRLAELVRCADLPTSLVVSGRFGLPATVELAAEPLPLRRFLEHPRVHYPGVELVADAELTRGSDPYLDDHVLDGSVLLPAVIGLEAMACVARALTGDTAAPAIHDARFQRPVTVPSDGSRHVRVAGLRRRDGSVDVVLRSDESGFQADHFRATFRFGEAPALGTAPPAGEAPLALDPAEHLYGPMLFHGPRFQRLRSYRELSARSCVAEIDVRDDETWFGAYLPQGLELGDPGARDAAIHAVQACIPHERLVPVGIERIAGDVLRAGRCFARATERSQDGDTYVYDVVLHDEAGRVRERWDGLSLRRIGPIALPQRWPAALIPPYLERRLDELVGDRQAHVALLHATGSRRDSADIAIARALRHDRRVLRRADGRPVTNGGTVSAAHLNGCTLAVAGAGRVACDIELAARRPQRAWRDLLGEERLELARRIAVEGAEALDRAATRVWSAAECIKKAGLPVGQPLKLAGAGSDGWTLLRCDDARVATLATRVAGIDGDVVLAVLAGDESR
ncbi:MAG TPA: SDR family NAD(P)-dependent oxidoreductase [Solirubrobacteraceae bacterium]|nr:SDR family NAD(P)-dependent oxidoreductase [Solirubrobacteraceae bacterium]